jgi:tetratricopeptide (TPR) repeat protein
LEIDTKNYFVFNYRGVLFSHLKRYNRAIECFDKALELSFDDYAFSNKAYALANKGYALISQNNYIQAISCFESVKSVKKGRDPLLAYALNGIGVALDELGRYEEAIEHFDKAMAIDPQRQNISHFNIGRTKFKIGQYSRALENFRRIKDPKLESQKNNAIALCNFKLGLYEEAESDYKEAIKTDPENPESFYNLGILYYTQGKESRSKILFNTCIDIDGYYIKAKNALKQIEGSNQLSDWYQWWFKSDKLKKMLGIFLITTIILIFSVTIFVSIFDSNGHLFNIANLFNFMSHISPNMGQLQNNTVSNNTTTNTPNTNTLTMLIVLLLVILLLPSLKTIKMGTVELTTAPITTSMIEIKPSTPMPFKSLYMPLHFQMPLKSSLKIVVEK